MSLNFQRFDILAVTPEHGAPNPEKVLDGQPKHTIWEIENHDGVSAGVWECTPGAWRVTYDEWEVCHILSGHSVLEEKGGGIHDLRAGDSFIIRPGFKGIWRVIETTRKEYIVKP
ncbi:MAG: cupin domain-containing protein [Phyllobacteriaceae bacterium]|nr:cupin domain-containing protein [Phyllobacteriaceae bacterium]